MKVGHGDIAQALNDRMDCIIFASGVSNSQCVDEKEYDREKHLLSQFYGTSFCLIYFSSISVDLVKSRYTAHKLEMEELIRDNFQHYNIIRLGNITFGNNPNTFINYLRNNPEAEIRDEWKYLISRDQLALIVDSLPIDGRNEISVFGEIRKVKDCL